MKHLLLKAAVTFLLPVTALSQNIHYKNLVLEGGREGARRFFM
jgi:hypothetical protein